MPRYVVFSLLLLVSATGRAADSYLLAPREVVAGKTQETWSREWWQWAGSFDESVSPVADRSGAACASKQSGPVWFLAGTYGVRRTLRTCTVPRGKYLFFPLINYVVLPTAEGSVSCAGAIRAAADITDDVSHLVLDVDGTRHAGLERHRQATRACFNLAEKSSPRYEIYPTAANGYYVMLRPCRPEPTRSTSAVSCPTCPRRSRTHSSSNDAGGILSLRCGALLGA
jgi:hypothetical protein